LYRIVVPPTLTIRLLGPVRVLVRGEPLAVDTRKAIALLAYLAMTDRPASREALAALLWPDSGDQDARSALRRTLSVLNAAVGGVGLAIDRTSVTLSGDRVEVDVRAFRAALARARDHGHPPDEACRTCIAALEEAAALDRGDFMAGFALRDSDTFDEWQRAEGEAHSRDLAGTLERLARGRAAAGAWESAVTAGRRWIELDPLHEPAHRLLMTTLGRAGEPAAAIRQYRECVRILDAELGVAPLEETTELYEAIHAGRLVPDVGRSRRVDPGPSAARVGDVPLVGRDRELDAFLAAHRSCGPDGRLVVIEGEPGIGKSRLGAAAGDAIRAAGGAVLEARAYAGESTIAFGPVVELVQAGFRRADATERLRSMRPEDLVAVARLVPLPIMPGAAPARPDIVIAPDLYGRLRLLEGLAEVVVALAGGPVPGLVAIDDLHLADASTIDFVAFLARRLRGRPLILLATWRREELSDDDAARVLGSAGRDAPAIRLRLDRLDRGDVGRVASALLGAAATEEFGDALFAESEGLPLYLAEALASPAPIGGAIPGGVLSLLRARIGSVGEIAGQLMAAAAVIGRSFDLDTVQSASGRSEDETIVGLEELVHRGLVREVGPTNGEEVRYDFTHGRLRDVAYESLGLARRRLLHRRVAEALGSSARGEGAGRWPLIAYHERLAGRTAEAAEAHRHAGDAARSVFANHEAREHLEAALALGHPATVELREALGDVLTLLGDYAGALAQFESAAALAGPARQSAIEHRLGLVHARRGDWSLADSHLIAALSTVDAADAMSRSALLADRSAVAQRRGATDDAEHLAAEALGLAEAAADSAGIARAADILGIVARSRHDLTAAAAYLEGALAAADAADDASLRAATRNTLALVCADAGDHARAIALTLEALMLCERLGDRHRQAALENNLADLLQAIGRRDEALDHLKHAVAIFADVGGRPGELEPEIWKLVEW
jgi:DNA-binding SARP family transcriptional activator